MNATALQPEIVNAYLDDDERSIVVRERVPGGPTTTRRVRAEYASWHRADEIGPEAMRQLKRLDIVRAITPADEHGWLRVGWTGPATRRMGLRGMRANEVDSYEGDVDPVLLWLVETPAAVARPRRCYLDLEADSRVPLSRKEDMRILSYAVVDHDTGEEHSGVLASEDDAAERALLTELLGVLESFDQISAWEGDWKGGEFDSVVLPARWRHVGIDVDERRWLWLNQLAVWRRMNMHSAESGAEKESLSLESIAHEQIGEGKERVPDFVRERFGDRAAHGLGAMTWDLYEAGGEFRDLLLRYNVRDAVLLRKLEQRKGYITLFQALCAVCGIIPENRSLQPTRQMDGFMLRLGRKLGRRFPTKRYSEDAEGEAEEQKKFKGAFVLHPKTVDPGWRADHGMTTGILRNVHVCDFAGMYPSLMLTFNLGAEVKVGHASDPSQLKPGQCLSPGTGLVTRTDEHGMVTTALREMIRLRKEWADLAATLPPGTPEFQDAMSRSTAYKVAANSFYGAGGSPYCRFYDREVSESTTQNGVHFLKLAAAEAEKRAMQVVYGDTDSNMVIGPSIKAFGAYVDWLNAKRFPEEVARHGCVENHVKIAFEKSFDRIVFVAAKRYIARYSHYKWSTTCNHCRTAKGGPGSVDVRTLRCRDCGHQYQEIPRFLGKPEIKGLEYKRGDKGKLARELQGRAIDMLVGGVTLKDEHGKDVPINPGLATPIDDERECLAALRAAVEQAQGHVLGEPLPIEEVKWSKGLSKSLREYGADASEVHVRVAKQLVERGQAMAKGMRVEYVIVDGSSSPMRAIPAEDYAGECDRFYLWERVYTPTQGLLEAAFPGEDWKRYADVKDKPRRGKRGRPPPDEQLGLHLAALTRTNANEELAVPAYSSRPLVVRIPEAAGLPAIDRVKAVIEAHPGARAVEIVLALASGQEATFATKLRVSPGPRFREEVEAAIALDSADKPT